MGLFLAISGVIGCDAATVVDALGDYAASRAGSLEEEPLTTEDEGCLVVAEGRTGVTVLYPNEFFDWDDAAEFISGRLDRPVFSCHIHDGDLWMYVLYENGEVVDQFNPIPEYWGELEEHEWQGWQGDASAVAERVPGLAPEQIARYLVQWGEDVLEADVRKKAYPADKFYCGDDWQLVDFMDKLGLDYPLDDRGDPRGVTYRFLCQSEEAS